MKIHRALFLVFAGPVLASCYTHVRPAVIAWREGVPIGAPLSAAPYGRKVRAEPRVSPRLFTRTIYLDKTIQLNK